MNNQERQMKLDDEKWFASQKVNYDLAGAMDWCNYCCYSKHSNTKSGKECTYTKTKGTPCVTAYNKMVKAK